MTALLLLVAVAATPQAEATPAAAPAERLICKSRPETGSLVRRTRECHTARDWNRIADAVQNGAARTIDELRGKPLGGP